MSRRNFLLNPICMDITGPQRGYRYKMTVAALQCAAPTTGFKANTKVAVRFWKAPVRRTVPSVTPKAYALPQMRCCIKG